MYVIPYLMGPAGSPLSRAGVMVTDSAYVIASKALMTRVGAIALGQMRHDESLSDLGEFYRQFGTRRPAALPAELARTARRLTT